MSTCNKDACWTATGIVERGLNGNVEPLKQYFYFYSKRILMSASDTAVTGKSVHSTNTPCGGCLYLPAYLPYVQKTIVFAQVEASSVVI